MEGVVTGRLRYTRSTGSPEKPAFSAQSTDRERSGSTP